jgi:hypothetical protein
VKSYLWIQRLSNGIESLGGSRDGPAAQAMKDDEMAVLMVSEVPGQTRAGYEAVLAAVSGPLARAAGFVTHLSHPVEGGWRVVEVWETREDAARFFAEHIARHLPAGIRPKLTFTDLHDVLRPATADV